jgi:TonB family protein
MFRLFVAGMIVTMAHAATVAGPSQFYAVSVFFSDNGARFYYRIIDVRQDGADTVVRYIRVAPTGFCPRLVVEAAEARMRGTSPARMSGTNNPCAIGPEALNNSAVHYKRSEGVLEAISFGVVSQCGQSTVGLRLPMDEEIDLKRLAKAHPEMARLWDLPGAIADRAFGKDDLFRDRREEDEFALQEAGEKLVPEILSGIYDLGLRLAVSGNVGGGRSPTFAALLAGYHGPVKAGTDKPVPELLNRAAYRFIRYEPAAYPSLALSARVQGRVELQLAVQPGTGEVNGATLVTGSALLAGAAIEAAKRWRFLPDSVQNGGVNVTLEFDLGCH